MKKLNKKKVIISIILIIFIIIEIIAFGLSRAKDIKSINVTVVDNSQKLTEEECLLSATNGGDLGYYIILPDVLTDKVIEKYFVTQKTIQEATKQENENVQADANIQTTNSLQENSNTNTQTTNSLQENLDTNMQTSENSQEDTNVQANSIEETSENSEENYEETVVEKLPGDKIYLTQEEIDNAQITLTVQYQTKQTNGKELYNKQITDVTIVNTSYIETSNTNETNTNEINANEVNANEINTNEINANEVNANEINTNETIQEEAKISVRGYMPLNAKVSLSGVNEQETIELINEEYGDLASLTGIYNIKITSDGEQYLQKDYNEILQVTFLEIKESKQYVLATLKDGVLQEVENYTRVDNTIVLKTNEFSTYVLIDVTSLVEQNNAIALYDENYEVTTLSISEDDISKEKGTSWDGSVASSFEHGSGTQAEPYLISTGAELAYLAQRVNNGNTYEGTYFQLTNDIELSGQTWTPIGDNDTSFRGIFDGAGHKISNAVIQTVTSLPTYGTIYSYGIFGSIGGGSSTYAEVKNLEITGIEVSIRATGTTQNSTYYENGFHVGVLVGSMYRNSKVSNIIVKDSSVTDTGTITLRKSYFHVFVGGIVGTAKYSSSSTSDPGDGNRYAIENCYSETTIDLGVALRNNTVANAGQYNVGGIIGSIRSQPVWPENCLYNGAITANYGMVGPIFGALRNNTATTNTSYFATLWNGNDAGNLTMDSSYYTGYSVNGTSFTTTVQSGTSTARRSNTTTNIGYVQGVNKGIYTTNMTTMLNMFNTYASTDERYTSWKYVNGEFTFAERLLVGVAEPQDYVYVVLLQDEYSSTEYTYNWYIDGVLDDTIVGNTLAVEGSFDYEYEVCVVVSDGTYYGLAEFTIPKLYIEIVFNIDYKTDTVTANLAGTALPYINIADYTFQWYKEDLTGDNIEEIEGANSLVLTGLESMLDYRLVATNNVRPALTTQNSFTYGERTVIYVDYDYGNNSNDGFTPETPVKTFETAYGKFNSDTIREGNIIVLMSDYTDTGFLDTANSTTFRKNVTITGKYKGTDYSPTLNFEAYNNGYKYLNGDTTFMYLAFSGSYIETNWWGSTTTTASQTYFYLQGYSLTMGDGIEMTGYATSNTNQGLIEGTSPAFHIIAGWLRYDYATLPRNNTKILIKSGTYGRIILGGSPGTTGASNLQCYTSHNFTGSSTSDMFNIEVTIDIQRSTTPSNYAYDVNLLVGGAACGNTYANVTENIIAGTVGRVLGASIGDSSDRPSNWNYPINTFLGSTTINISGGTIREVYGGCLGRNMNALSGRSSIICDSYFYGTININISGGAITQTIYGAGAGGVTGYSENSTDEYKSYGQEFDTVVNINITGGEIDADIYGGGYGYTEYLTTGTIPTDGGSLYGTSNINISGSPVINGDIYAGGRGYNLNSKPNLAQMEGNTNITIEGTPTITGNIYGAGMGISGYSEMAKLTGNSTINVNANLATSVYGGGNIAPTLGNTNIYVNSGTHTADIYGGGNVGEVDGDSYMYITGGASSDIYGGGNQAGVNNTNISITGGTTSTVYGGSNMSGEIDTTTINATGGTVTNIYGGNNAGGTCPQTSVTVNGVTIEEAVYGGGNQVSTQTTNVYLKTGASIIPEVYGGGKSADATTTNVYCQGGNAQNVFGGSNTTGTVQNSTITATSGTITNIYGGNNAGGETIETLLNLQGVTATNVFGGGNQAQTTNTDVNMDAGTVENIYGGGNLATVATTNVDMNAGTVVNIYGGGNQATVTTSNVNIENGTVQNVFGGGNQAGATTTNVNLNGGKITDAFGGSNQSGNVTNANVTTNGLDTKSTAKEGLTMQIDYTIAAAESWQSTVYPTLVTFDITIKNNSTTTMNTWEAQIKAEIAEQFSNYTGTALTIENGTVSFNQVNTYYGNNTISPGGEYNFKFEALSTANLADFKIETYNISGKGTDGNSYEDSDKKYLEIDNVYGGNNAGGVTTTPIVTVSGGNIQNIYGGGNNAVVETTNVTISEGKIENAYGGGNAAGVNQSTNITMSGGTINTNIYGGGNEGTVTKDTNIDISGGNILGSAYAGGNGQSAIVLENTNINVHGNVTIGTTSSVAPQSGSVFGGGNAAATGQSSVNSSVATVNIAGVTMYGNVYGGANTSVVYGNTVVNIGAESITDKTLQKADIYIKGTVFGGGEANASGSEVYDFSFISVTKGIEMNINATDYTNYRIGGSIFGSGNASSTSGKSYINITKYGSVDTPQKNVSIQRATTVTLDNSAISLSGATDRTNEYSTTFFTLSRVDEVKLKNDSTLYLDYGANLLKKLSSLVDENGAEVKAVVTIDENTGDTTKNVDNRIYMREGKNLNIATNEQVTAYGEVYGMTFFGLYTNTTSPSTSTGLYNHELQNGDEISNAGTFISNSYILAMHLTNHDIKADGFYTNYDEGGNVKVNYIGVTPEDDVYYIWLVGEEMEVTTFEVGLTASKYATLGTYELPLTGFSTPNIKFSIIGFSAGLAEGISLVNENEISPIAPTDEIADSVFGLTMKSGKNGWKTNNTTKFYTANGGTYSGDSAYNSDNSNYTPTLTLSFYHSQNLTLKQNLGEVKIRFQVITPIDDLNYSVSYIDINITLATALYQDDYYEASISPGEEFELFTTTETNITDSSIFSTYYSLFIPDFSESDYYDDYKTYHRVLVSRDIEEQPYVYPENTKITMLDFATNKYYYYNVTKEDEENGKYLYNLADFIKMGSTDEYYNESSESDQYYNTTQNLVYENFIFHVDFRECTTHQNAESNALLMELQDTTNQTLIGVLGIQRDSTRYGIYSDKDATIDVSAEVSPTRLYIGDILNLDVTTNFTQNIVASKTIYDTHYFDNKMGIKITIYDSNGNMVSGDSLLGIKFNIDGTYYYPRIDGTTRIKIADRVSNVLSKIQIDTTNCTTIATGTYTIKIESYGSPDGIYYGLEASDSVEKTIEIINGTYGLKAYTDTKTMIVDKETGHTLNGNNSLVSFVEYSSQFENPKITISMQRRKYDTEYSTEYEIVDIKDYVTNTLTAYGTNKEYLAISLPVTNNTYFLTLKSNLRTGTYKIYFKLYDNDTFIGEVYEYIIIK